MTAQSSLEPRSKIMAQDRDICLWRAMPGTSLDLTPDRPARINQLELDRRNSEQRDHGRLLCVPLHAVIMRGAGNALDEAAGRNRNRMARIEVRTAVHPP